MTKRQQIVDAIETALKGVAAFGGRVYPWLRVDLPVASLPALAVYDTTANHDKSVIGIGSVGLETVLDVTVEILASGKTSAAQTRNYMGDVQAAMVADPIFGGLVEETLLSSSDLDLAQEGNVVAAGRMTYTVRYRTTNNTL